MELSATRGMAKARETLAVLEPVIMERVIMGPVVMERVVLERVVLGPVIMEQVVLGSVILEPTAPVTALQVLLTIVVNIVVVGFIISSVRINYLQPVSSAIGRG